MMMEDQANIMQAITGTHVILIEDQANIIQTITGNHVMMMEDQANIIQAITGTKNRYALVEPKILSATKKKCNLFSKHF